MGLLSLFKKPPAPGVDFPPGMTVKVLTAENKPAFVGKVERYRNGAVTIQEEKGGEVPPVVYNTEVKLSFVQDGKSGEVHGRVCGSSAKIWKLDRLEAHSAKENRAAFRQSISVEAPAKCARLSGAGRPPTPPAPCQVLDVSAGGISFSSEEEYAVGDRLSITDVHLVKYGETFRFRCQVRRAGEREDGVVRYGCQFEPLSPREEDLLLEAIFTAQRQQLRRQKDKEGR